MLQGYGLTETSPVISVNRPENRTRLLLVAHSAGLVAATRSWSAKSWERFKAHEIGEEHLREVRTGDAGVLLVAGDAVFDGYLGMPKEKQPFAGS